MILDHQSTRLLADHGPDWTDAVGRAVAGLGRWFNGTRTHRAFGASATNSLKSQEIGNARQF